MDAQRQRLLSLCEDFTFVQPNDFIATRHHPLVPSLVRAGSAKVCFWKIRCCDLLAWTRGISDEIACRIHCSGCLPIKSADWSSSLSSNEVQRYRSLTASPSIELGQSSPLQLVATEPRIEEIPKASAKDLSSEEAAEVTCCATVVQPCTSALCMRLLRPSYVHRSARFPCDHRS